MEKYLKKFIIYTFVWFILLIGVIGAFIFVLDMPIVGGILQIVGAWTSTLVFFAMFKKIYPKDNLWHYIRRQFRGEISLPVIISILSVNGKYFSINLGK